MDIELRSDFPVTDEACREATGKTLGEWSSELEAKPELAGKRRDGVQWICDSTGRTTSGVWWATTIWVEHERRLGKVAKDGRPEGYHICSTKSVAAPATAVQEALVGQVGEVTRVREGKDIRANWRTPGVDGDTEIEVALAPNGAKTGITVNHKRIPTREEADAMRRHWASVLDKLKKDLEA